MAGRDARSDAPGEPSRWLDNVRRGLRVDLDPRAAQPSRWRLTVATVAALVLSLALDEVAVHLARANFPTTRHFSHFRPADYASLTVIGVLVGCGAWSVVTRVTSAPRWLFFRLVVLGTVLLWIPDGVLLSRGEATKGVAVLMGLHLAIALVTYNLLVHLAPVREDSREHATHGNPALSERTVRHIWTAMGAVVGIDLVLGIATIVTVPFRRPNALFPVRGAWVYGAHGALGLVLGAGAVAVLVLSPLAGRMARIGAAMGAVGTAIGLGGGVFALFQATRLLAMGVMLVGAVVAGIGYLVPALEAMGKAEAARAEAARAERSRAEEARTRVPGTNGKRE